MRIEEIEADLKQRIDQTHDWLASLESPVIDGLSIANGPYVAICVLEVGTGKGHLSFLEQFEGADAYFQAGDDTIQDWYAKWLQRLLRLRTGTTVFKHMEPT